MNTIVMLNGARGVLLDSTTPMLDFTFLATIRIVLRRYSKRVCKPVSLSYGYFIVLWDNIQNRVDQEVSTKCFDSDSFFSQAIVYEFRRQNGGSSSVVIRDDVVFVNQRRLDRMDHAFEGQACRQLHQKTTLISR